MRPKEPTLTKNTAEEKRIVDFKKQDIFAYFSPEKGRSRDEESVNWSCMVLILFGYVFARRKLKKDVARSEKTGEEVEGNDGGLS